MLGQGVGVVHQMLLCAWCQTSHTDVDKSCGRVEVHGALILQGVALMCSNLYRKVDMAKKKNRWD